MENQLFGVPISYETTMSLLSYPTFDDQIPQSARFVAQDFDPVPLVPRRKTSIHPGMLIYLVLIP